MPGLRLMPELAPLPGGYLDSCRVCRNLAGLERFSPGPWIYEGKYWRVDHAYPVKVLGWLVVVLKRHTSFLHELTEAEFAELGWIQAHGTRLLHEILHNEREYMASFSEQQRYQHINVHILAVPADLPPEALGSLFFGWHETLEQPIVSPGMVTTLAWRLRDRFETAS
jgi:diadenosine tetraphosphate (Ap4A) HIT family hydrolase